MTVDVAGVQIVVRYVGRKVLWKNLDYHPCRCHVYDGSTTLLK